MPRIELFIKNHARLITYREITFNDKVEYEIGDKHYLVVTAWGQEASDEIVVNHKMN